MLFPGPAFNRDREDTPQTMKRALTASGFSIVRRNVPRAGLSDIYYVLTSLRWRSLLGLAFVGYMVLNVIFGAIYYVLRDGLTPADLGFTDCFFFSVHTFSTVGYGSIIPQSLPVHITTLFETFAGLTSVALTTGLYFAKFSRPSARFMFSEHLLITQHMGRVSLVFRVMNTRNNRVMDASVSLSALYDEVSPEGIRYRRFAELPLTRSHTPVFALSLTANHSVEGNEFTEDLLARVKNGENIEFMASIRGLDETFGQTIHAVHVYRRADLRTNAQFADILHVQPDGLRVIDFAQFNEYRIEGTRLP